MTTIATLSPAAATSATSRRRGLPSLVWLQVRYDVKSLLRNRQAQFFTIALPLGFLALFVAIFGNTQQTGVPGLRMSTYYVANLTVFGIIDAGFMTLAITLVDLRERGVLRRRQATPQPAWVIMAARAVTALGITAATAVLLLLVGRFAYGARVPTQAVPALLAAVVVGCFTSCALGFAMASAIKSFQSAQPTVMGLALPLFFISGVFVPWSLIPRPLRDVAAVFPVRPLALAVLTPYTRAGALSPWRGADLAVVAAWGVAGAVVALRRFHWAPRDV